MPLETATFVGPFESTMTRPLTTFIPVYPVVLFFCPFSPAIEEEGIFRVSGAASEVRALRAAYEARQPGVHVDLSGVGDPNVVAAVLKAYLKDLPEPVIPFDYLDTFLGTLAPRGGGVSVVVTTLVAALFGNLECDQ